MTRSGITKGGITKDGITKDGMPNNGTARRRRPATVGSRIQAAASFVIPAVIPPFVIPPFVIPPFVIPLFAGFERFPDSPHLTGNT